MKFHDICGYLIQKVFTDLELVYIRLDESQIDTMSKFRQLFLICFTPRRYQLSCCKDLRSYSNKRG